MLKVLGQVTASAVFVLVAAFLGLLLWRSLFPAEPVNHNTSNPQNTNAQRQGAPENSNGPNGTTEDSVAYYTAWLAAFTALLVLVSAFQIGFLIRADDTARATAKAAKDSADIAGKALIASNRPWVRVEIAVGGPISYNANGMNVQLNFAVTNIGHSPALSVWFNPAIIAPAIGIDGNFNPRDILLKTIDIEKQRPRRSVLGLTLFPGDTVVQPIGLSINADELKRITQKVEFVMPEIIGTVEYRTVLDDVSHHTGYIVDIRRADTPRLISKERNRSPSGIFPDEGDIPADQVRLVRSLFDVGFAD